MKSLTRVTLAAAILFQSVNIISAHEFWLEPQDYQPSSDQIVTADIYVGQDFKGDNFPFIPQLVELYRVFDSTGMGEPAGQAGDRPALQVAARQSGLLVFAYQSSTSRLTYDSSEMFENFIDYEGLTGVLEEHRARGLPDVGFTESFSRFPKTLIDVDGTGEGEDLRAGLRAELVALDNPYALNVGDQLRVQLLWEGQTEANRQVKVFAKPLDGTEGELRVTDYFTDADGIARFDLEANTSYMLSAVKMVATDPAMSNGSVWESFWASLTFGISQ